jgi:hypothetical protein
MMRFCYVTYCTLAAVRDYWRITQVGMHNSRSQWLRSLRCVFGRLVAGIAGSNPTRAMDVYFLCLCAVLSCVGRGLCDGPITRPEESYCVSNSV